MARWMTGESYFHQENYAAALAEYLQVDNDYPFPRWQPAALLQAGKCHECLGQWARRSRTYERLLIDFPDSELAAEADSARRAARGRGAAGSDSQK